MTTGNIHSVQTLGTLDGPGIRYVLFMQGCPLRCSCCHNPDTWEFGIGKSIKPEEAFTQLLRYRSYFGNDGGITISGGEAIMQPKFAAELFSLCKKEKIHTCLDTSGCALDPDVKELLALTDLVLLDIKYTNDEDCLTYTGMTLSKALEFLEYLEHNNIDTWIRQVIITGINDTDENARKLAEITSKYACIKKVEFLAFRKLCCAKYDALGIPFPFADKSETTKNQIDSITAKYESFKENYG